MQEQCPQHSNLMSEIANLRVATARIEERVINIDKRINGSIDDIHDHIKHGQNWRMSIVGTIVGVLITVGSAIYYYGELKARVCDNEAEIVRLRK
jgi:hypothetical protein